MRTDALIVALLGVRAAFAAGLAALDALIAAVQSDGPTRQSKQSKASVQASNPGSPKRGPKHVGLPLLSPDPDLSAQEEGRKGQELGEDKSNVFQGEGAREGGPSVGPDASPRVSPTRKSNANGASVQHGPGPDGLWTEEQLRRALAGGWDGVGGLTTSGSNRARLSALEPIVRRIAERMGKDPMTVFTAAVLRFKSDPNIRAKRLGLSVFVDQFEQWADDAPPPRHNGPGEVSTEFDDSLNPEYTR